MAFGTLDYRSTFAVDKDNSNQNFSGEDWEEISSNRILWDINSDYVSDDNIFIVPVNGVYFLDMQIRFISLVNVARIEVALWKRDPAGEDPDDYWFVLADRMVGGETIMQLTAATSFDFYEGEQYILKARLIRNLPLINPTATLSGNDDYTAWGIKFEKGFLVDPE